MEHAGTGARHGALVTQNFTIQWHSIFGVVRTGKNVLDTLHKLYTKPGYKHKGEFV